MVARGLRFISIALVVLMVAAVAVSVRPDASLEDAIADYGSEPSQFLTLTDGARIHVRDEGPRVGDTIILLHCAGGSLHEWDPWVRELEKFFRIVRLDLPGHGLTGRLPGDDYSRRAMGNVVLEVADQLGIDGFALAGADLGGAVAWDLARRDGAHVSHLILIAPEGIGFAPNDASFQEIAARNPLTRPLARWIAPRWAFANQLYKSYTDDNFVTDALIDRYARLGRLSGNRTATVRRLAGPPERPISEFDGGIDVPTAILWGEDDLILPLDQERVEWDLRTKFAGGPQVNPLYTFADVGHFPHVEQAILTAAFAGNFIATRPLENSQ